MSESQEIERGARAERLLKDPLLSEAFESVRQAIFAKIEETPLRDRDALHEWRLMLKLLRDVRANLEQAVQGGKYAAFRLEEKRRFKLFG